MWQKQAFKVKGLDLLLGSSLGYMFLRFHNIFTNYYHFGLAYTRACIFLYVWLTDKENNVNLQSFPMAHLRSEGY